MELSNNEEGVMERATVIKRGEMCIETSLQRSSEGLTIVVRAHPGVEDFMRNLGGGNQCDVGTVGRHWQPREKGTSLMAYVIPAIGLIALDVGKVMSVEYLGHPIIIQDGKHEIVNLSFMRLVGISEGIGVRFGLKGVYSGEALTKLRDNIALASKKFYVEYLRPVDMTVTVSTQELQK